MILVFHLYALAVVLSYIPVCADRVGYVCLHHLVRVFSQNTHMVVLQCKEGRGVFDVEREEEEEMSRRVLAPTACSICVMRSAVSKHHVVTHVIFLCASVWAASGPHVHITPAGPFRVFGFGDLVSVL